MYITLIISSLGPGGAERRMSAMANYWSERGHKVTLITLAETGADFYALHTDIHRVGLGLMGDSFHIFSAMTKNLQRVRRLRQEIVSSKPDVVLSFLDKTNVLTLVASLGLGIPVIVSERTDPRHHSIGRIWQYLRRLLYPKAAGVVMVTDDTRAWAERFIPRQFVHVIPNPVAPSGYQMSHGGGKQPTVAAMGRLSREKGFDILLKAFALCLRQYPDWHLIILGEGPERDVLEALVCELDIKDHVALPGIVQNPSTILSQIDLFALTSRYEGFPNALVEAMALGRAVVSTNCPSGPADIIQDGINGVLVPSDNLPALTLALERLMGNQAERHRLGARAVEVLERFSVPKIMRMWDDVLAQACAC